MIIGIDALNICPGEMGGGEIYFRNVFDAIIRNDKSNKYFVFVNKRYAESFRYKADNVKVVSCNLLGASKLVRVFWEQLAFPFKLKAYNIDIVHTFGQTGLLFIHCKSAMTIHDLQHHYYPRNFSLLRRAYLQIMVWLTAKRADKVITISNSSRNDIIKLLKIPGNKVQTIYESSRFGSNPVIISEEDKSRVRTKYKLFNQYVLSVASMLPHKNLTGLIRAFSLLSEDKVTDLVLVGMKLKSLPKVMETIKSAGLCHRRVKLLGYVPDKDMPALYSMAELLAFPSFFEGFGLPTLEAMNFGCPVVASNCTSIPEVVGDASLLVDPHDHKDIADKMNTVLVDKQCRDNLIQKGYERIKCFSWDKLACEILAVYEDIVN
jgi:glycosyltransferase involved in cell wall biosynthesis